ncbi:MAG: ATP-grasp fold amidoligase family protein [Sphingomicrobium sp.]
MSTLFSPSLLRGVSVSNGGAAARLRVRLAYWWRHGRLPDLDAPRLFTEWVQWRKLNERSLLLAAMTDKGRSKAMVAASLGPEWVVPTLWQGQVAPKVAPWPTPFVIKSSHGCNQYAIVRDAARDWPEALERSRAWTQSHYGYWLDEWLYSKSAPGLIVEPFIGQGEVPPKDYKVYVFNGVAAVVQVHSGRLTDHRWVQYDCAWNRLSNGSASSPPDGLAAMIDAAEALGRGHDFLRVDFYDLPGQPLFGEFCLYPGSGLDRFDPVDLDLVLGEKWTAARSELARS